MSRFGCIGTWWLATCLAAASVNTAQAAEARAPDERRATHVVQPGDVLSVIAEQQGVSLADLRQVNGLHVDTIHPGQVLLLPTVYEVKRGDVPGIIAERHGVELSDLYRYNHLKEGSVLRVGQRLLIAGRARSQPVSPDASGKRVSRREVPAKPANQREPKVPEVEYYLHEVQRNEVLSVIAARYAVATKELCQINGLKDAALIRVGQRLKIPVTEQNARLTRPRPWSKYARKTFERGRVTLTTPGGDWTGQVLDDEGNVLPEARQHIQSLLASWETGRKVQIALHPRLYQLIVTVSDEFGGRPIRVVSGYRERSYARDSKHRVGRALDFSIPGVPNTAIVDFLLTLPETGVGYYPNVTHVHMDARAHRMYWVDVSGPGEPPRYVYKSDTGQRPPTLSSTSPPGHTLGSKPPGA